MGRASVEQIDLWEDVSWSSNSLLTSDFLPVIFADLISKTSAKYSLGDLSYIRCIFIFKNMVCPFNTMRMAYTNSCPRRTSHRSFDTWLAANISSHVDAGPASC